MGAWLRSGAFLVAIFAKGRRERQDDMDRRTFADGADHADVSAHGVDKSFENGQSQPRALVFSGVRSIHLGEWLEERIEFVLGMPMPVSVTQIRGRSPFCGSYAGFGVITQPGPFCPATTVRLRPVFLAWYRASSARLSRISGVKTSVSYPAAPMLTVM